jgi:hypothetical protein
VVAAHVAWRPIDAWRRALADVGFSVEAVRPVSVLSGGRIDGGIARRAVFAGLSRAASLAEPLGGALGAALYPAERFAVRRCPSTGSQNLMTCWRGGP